LRIFSSKEVPTIKPGPPREPLTTDAVRPERPNQGRNGEDQQGQVPHQRWIEHAILLSVEGDNGCGLASFRCDETRSSSSLAASGPQRNCFAFGRGCSPHPRGMPLRARFTPLRTPWEDRKSHFPELTRRRATPPSFRRLGGYCPSGRASTLWRITRPPKRPGTIERCIPTVASKSPVEPRWIHEIKHDGCPPDRPQVGGQGAPVHEAGPSTGPSAIQPPEAALRPSQLPHPQPALPCARPRSVTSRSAF
jgi:hypothetical protein